MEQLIIQTVSISRSGELKHFEIPLSKNVEMITGLWYKVRLLDTVTPINGIVVSLLARSTYVPEVIVGTLSLCSNQSEGVFFYGNLILANTNQGFLDFTSGVFAAKDHSHADFAKQLEVRIDGDTSTVHGFIQDNWGVISGRNVRYEVDIYIYQKLNKTEK